MDKKLWDILGIEPTTDIKQVKKAYAKKISQHHPEDSPEEYKIIQEAYQTIIKKLRIEKQLKEKNSNVENLNYEVQLSKSCERNKIESTQEKRASINPDAEQLNDEVQTHKERVINEIESTQEKKASINPNTEQLNDEVQAHKERVINEIESTQEKKASINPNTEQLNDEVQAHKERVINEIESTQEKKASINPDVEQLNDKIQTHKERVINEIESTQEKKASINVYEDNCIEEIIENDTIENITVNTNVQENIFMLRLHDVLQESVEVRELEALFKNKDFFNLLGQKSFYERCSSYVYAILPNLNEIKINRLRYYFFRVRQYYRYDIISEDIPSYIKKIAIKKRKENKVKNIRYVVVFALAFLSLYLRIFLHTPKTQTSLDKEDIEQITYGIDRAFAEKEKERNKRIYQVETYLNAQLEDDSYYTCLFGSYFDETNDSYVLCELYNENDELQDYHTVKAIFNENDEIIDVTLHKSE